MKTNRFINIKVALFIAVSVLMAACTIEDADQSVEPKGEKLDITTNIDVQPTTTSVNFDVKSDVSWTVSVKDSWEGLSVSPSSGVGDAQVTINTGENTTRKDRSATLTITTAGGVQQELVVRQIQSEPILEVTSGSGENLEFEAIPEASKSFTISCNTSWELTSDNWIHCNKTEGTSESLTATNVSVQVTEAQTDTVRTGVISVIAEGGKRGEIKVSQKGKDIELSVSPKNFTVNAVGEEKTIQISCNADWKIEFDNELFTCETMSGTGNADVKVTCLPNNLARTRTSTLKVTSGEFNKKIEELTFVQDAATPPVLTGFVLIENSVTKNEAEFQFTFESMYPIEKYGIKIWETSESQQTPMDPAINTEGGITKLIFKATKLKSMTTYHVYGYIENSVGKSDCRDVNIADITFTTGGVKPDDGDNPVPNLSRRKK